MEIDEETHLKSCQTEIRQNGSAVHGVESFHCLELDDHASIDDHIESVSAIQLNSAVRERNGNLSRDRAAALREDVGAAGLVCGLEQSRTGFAMYLYRGADDRAGDLIDVHLSDLRASAVNLPFEVCITTSSEDMPEQDLSMRGGVL